MNKTTLVVSMIGSWGVSLTFERIATWTGERLYILIWLSAAMFLYGLYKGLLTNNKYNREEET